MELRSQNLAKNDLVGGHNFAEPANLPEHLCIGKEMHNFVYELKNYGAHILDLLAQTPMDTNVRELLEKYITQYSNQSCKVAVVGQMKAGKSAFINALIGRHNFLPSDVNPWTTVVTRLHFGVPSLPLNGAHFKFFDENEWNSIAHGGGRLRELVERFLPGFTSDKLEAKLSELRDKAVKRFGPECGELLGNSHTFDNVQSDLIEKYVCAGNAWSEGNSDQDAGHFSDITKSADLFFKSSPFLYPTSLIDTPGTNDPFFVRDEITYRNLEDADIFVVVLPAHQAFSMSDLALLKILQGLNKDRILIFINRVDQLGDLRNDTREIVSHVRYVLDKEFPSIRIPVVVGSAHWGQQALERDFSNVNLESDPINEFLTDEDYQQQELLRSKLYYYSGIPDVASEISRMMLKGKGRNSVGMISSNLKLATDSMRAVVEEQISRTQPGSPDSPSEAELQSINSQLEYLQNYTTTSNYFHIQYEKRLASLQDALVEILKKKLRKVVHDFAMLESRNLIDSISNGGKDKVWRCDTMIIKKCLEEEYHVVTKEAIKQFNKMQQEASQELKQLLNEAAPDMDNSYIVAAPIAEAGLQFSSMALKNTVALDLDVSWWKLWGARKRQCDQWAEELLNLIKNEFETIIQKLIGSAQKEFSQIIGDSNRNFSAISKSIANVLMERAYQLQERSDVLLDSELNAQNMQDSEQMQSEKHQKYLGYVELLKQIDVVTGQLSQLSKRYETLCHGSQIPVENVQ